MSYTELREDVIAIIKDFLKEGNLQVVVSSRCYGEELVVQLYLEGEIISTDYTTLPSNNPNA